MTTIRLLIVEDDPKIAEIQRRFVERVEQVELCGIAHTLADARDLIDVLEPELILLDVYFPDGNGLDLLRELRARDRRSDVILITAAKEVETLRSALRGGGVFDYILKPPWCSSACRKPLTLPGASGQAAGTEQARPERGRCTVTQSHHRHRTFRARTAAERCRQPDAGQNQRGGGCHWGGHWSAEEMGGAEIGASRTTARRYLEFLVGTGELCAEVNYGSVGRPERRYCLKA